MRKISIERINKIGKYLLAMICLLVGIVLLLSMSAKNVVDEDRQKGDYQIAEQVTMNRLDCVDAPTGVVDEYKFNLGKIRHADTLAFFINHHSIEVYMDDKQVYSAQESNQHFRTLGGIWVMIPVYMDDSGKEVRVELYPLYSDYQEENVEFFVGSQLEIYKAVFLEALPELFLSLCVCFTGIFLLCIGIYYSIRKNTIVRLYAIGLLSVFTAVWRFTYGRYIYLIMPQHSVMVYTLSIISLMVIALTMLGCIDLTQVSDLKKRIIRYIAFIYCGIYIAQLSLQLTGIADLRQMLILTHMTLIISALLLFLSGFTAWIRRIHPKNVFFGRNYYWILGIGVLIDLILYYYADSSAGMMCTLGAILWASIKEGIRMIMNYTDQKIALDEMKTQLTLSRTTTMMSQIRSHFVFNLLNAISGMCKYDPEKADATVVRFARYLRNNIDIMEDDKNIPFTTDLQQLEDYVALEQVRFGDKVEFYTDIETDQFMIPPLILQPMVKNAIKHGISKKMGNGTIILRTRDKGDYIEIMVEDDGVGFSKEELEKEKSVGLRNIQFRLEHLVNGTFAITSKIGVGTVVTITIPKRGECHEDYIR